MLRIMMACLLLTSITTAFSQQDERSASLESFFASLAAAAEAGDRQAYASLFRPGAALFLPHRPPVIGRAAIGDWFESFGTKLELHIDSYEQQDIEIVGDVAMVRSHSVGHYLNRKTGERFPYDQKYLGILQYEDGQWKMSYHMGNSNIFDPGIWETNWESR